MPLEPLLLSHHKMLKDKFKELELRISEYSFANLYLFRDLHQYQLWMDQDTQVFIKGVSRDNHSFYMPTTSPEKWNFDFIISKFLHEVDYLFPIPEKWLSYFDSSLFTKSFSEDESDYVFLKEKMQTYTGRKLSSKRNLVKQLLEHYSVKFFPITNERLSDAFYILENWQLESKYASKPTDYSACEEAIRLFDILELSGLIFYIDSQPCAFLIGEKLSDEYVIHFAKACRHVKGLYQYMYQSLAQLLEDSYKFINMEQDLGLPNIRQAKSSYEPDYMEKKWRIGLK